MACVNLNTQLLEEAIFEIWGTYLLREQIEAAFYGEMVGLRFQYFVPPVGGIGQEIEITFYCDDREGGLDKVFEEITKELNGLCSSRVGLCELKKRYTARIS